jgi:predicted DNA-binding WGR domain protein
MARAYRLALQWAFAFVPRETPGSGVDLVREWGRIGSPGQVRADPYPDAAQAEAAAEQLAAAKRRRGYQ